MNYFFKQILRIVEKIPGVCLLQVADFGDIKILLLPKVGTRSIRDALLAKHYPSLQGVKKTHAWNYISYYTREGLNREIIGKNIKLIVFVRDPGSRIASCWRQKIFKPEGVVPYFLFYYPYLYPTMTFSRFITRILRIPVPFMEKHFMPISYMIAKLDHTQLDFRPIEDLDDTLATLVTESQLTRANATKSVQKEGGDKVSEISETKVYKEDYELWMKVRF